MIRSYFLMSSLFLNTSAFALVAKVECRDHAGKTIAQLTLRYAKADFNADPAKGFMIAGQSLGILHNTVYYQTNHCGPGSKPADELGWETLVCATGSVHEIKALCYGEMKENIQK